MSLPYHIGNGWFGGMLPLLATAMVAATGDIYYGLWYPIVVALMTLVIGLHIPDATTRSGTSSRTGSSEASKTRSIERTLATGPGPRTGAFFSLALRGTVGVACRSYILARPKAGDEDDTQDFADGRGKLGPGLITGAADDDPSASPPIRRPARSSAFRLRWTVVLTYPLMVGIQMVSARIGRVTGHGLASNIRRHFPRPVLYGDRRAAGRRQHDQHRRRHRRDGRGAAAGRRRPDACVTRSCSASSACCCRCSCPTSAMSAT